MLRYVLIFLLVNTYNRSLGLPVGQQASDGTTSDNLFSELAKGCKNKFAANFINISMKECPQALQTASEPKIQLRCLMVYDASDVLCNSTVDLETLIKDFSAVTKTKQDLSVFCKEAAQLELPATKFLANVSEVVHNELSCAVVCADDKSITNIHSHVYCQYYKFMLGLVQPQVQIGKPLPGDSVPGVEEKKINDPSTSMANVPSVSDVLPKKDEPKESSSDTNNKITTNAESNPNHVEAEAANQEQSSMGTNQEQPPVLDDQKKPLIINETVTEPKKLPPIGIEDAQHEDNKSGSEVQPIVLPADLDKFESIGAGDGEMDNPGNDDEQEESNPDDEEVGGADKPLLEENFEKKPVIIKHDHSSVIADSSRADLMDGYAADDDHFFPFFLTAVIVVVVLYILYHNKNKVGKMFFGLIVEGRQPGRRRNSRGHAYRRLDTLEQAMSANATAPPSKIIY